MSQDPPARDIPVYSQHTNGCGLAALLMLVNVPEHPRIQAFLDSVWDEVGPMFSDPLFRAQELKWAIALQYILLKALAYGDKDDFYAFFAERLEFLYEDQRIMNKFTQEQAYNQLIQRKKMPEAYTYLHYTEGHDYITPIILFKNLHTMKTDLELKVLAEIFNYKFLYQESEDYTGAIYFTNKELGREIAQTARVKWNLLQKLAKDPKKIVLYGQYHHWLAVRGFYKISPQRRIPDEVLQEMEAKRKANSQPIERWSQKSAGSPTTAADNSSDPPKTASPAVDTPIDSPQSLNLQGGAGTVSPTLAEISEIFEDETDDWHPKRMIIDVNDPALVERVLMTYRDLNESDRFYIFERRPLKKYPAFKIFLKYLKADTQAEKVRWEDFLAKKEKDFGEQIQARAAQLKSSEKEEEKR